MSQLEAQARALDEPAQRAWTDEQDVALRLWVTLTRCHATCAKAIAAKVQDFGLTTPQFGTLEALYHLGPLVTSESGGLRLLELDIDPADS